MTSINVFSSMQRTVQGCSHRNIFYLFPSIVSSFRGMCTNEKCTNENPQNSQPSLPEEPTTCCMSGCANCVWIEYAEELSKIYEDGGEKAKEIILSKVTDPNTRAFLMMELKNLSDKT
ncbi:Oxidoreductase-like domain-containing protein 1 [Blattella germanica]|nr:Oxidoreductase-like domain-containing protein 1 [Blattella germanica]